MSGVEIAGLVLAVVPIVAAAAEHQRKVNSTASTILRAKVKDEKLASQYQHLHDEVALLNITMRNLISDLPTLTTDEKTRLLNLDRQLWKDDRVSLALSQKLGTSHVAFVDRLQSVLQNLDAILSDRVLKLEHSDIAQTPRTLYTKLESLRANGGGPNDLKGRIKFTSSDGKRRRALATLTEENKTLERFIRHQAPVESSETPDTPQGSDPWKWPPRSKSRNLIHNLYDAIARVWPLHCNCPLPHEARLSLWGCFIWFEDKSDDDLDLFISTGHEDRKWQESRVRVEHPQRRDSVVRFENTPSVAGSNATASSRSAQRAHVESMCAIVTQAHQSNVALEVVYDSSTLWHDRARKQRKKVMEPCTTLDQLLRHETNSQRKLKEKRVLAVILAHSLLHLCESKWLENEWDKTQISFFRSASDQLSLKDPYLNTDFQGIADGSDDGAMMQLHPSPAILALGILLLELQIWEPIEKMRLPEDLTEDGSVNVNTNLATAERVFQESVDDLFENYRTAIRACLDCDFSAQEVDFNDEGFRQSVYENIVAPLEKELYQGWKLKPTDI